MKKNNWKELIEKQNKLWDNGSFTVYINEIPKKLKMIYALAFSVAKWHPKNPHRGQGGVDSCGLCQLFYNKFCRGCPLSKVGEKCIDPGTLWQHWKLFHKKDKKPADKLFEVLLNLYREELEKQQWCNLRLSDKGYTLFKNT